MLILGLSAFFHDSAACLLRDGRLVAAAQEERFTRRKHDPAFPAHAIRACLDLAGVSFDQLDHVGFYEKPHLKFVRILQTYADFFPRGFHTFRQAIPLWLRGGKFALPGVLRALLLDLSPSGGQAMKWDGRIIFPEHHMSHAASAYFPSPFDEAAILTADGVGEWDTTTLAVGKPDHRGVPRVTFLKEIRYPDSLGMLYSAVTSFLGFKVSSGEYKVMGLAPYGTPRHVPLILERLIDLKDDGSFRLNMEYFRFPYDSVMTSEAFAQLLGMAPRSPETWMTQEHFDLAASIQKVTDLAIERMGRYVHRLTGLTRLCLAGGVALNCVANGRLWRNGPFEDLWVQPAAGDAGGAVGAAFYIWHEVLGERRAADWKAGADAMHGSYLGPRFDHAAIEALLRERRIKFAVVPDDRLPEATADLLAAEAVVGWFRGPMEFGPRALGARSILGDARSRTMQQVMNLKVKYRESFRPFAPAVLRERVGEWFDLQGKPGSLLGAPLTPSPPHPLTPSSPPPGYDSPYMLLVAPVRPDKCFPMSDAEQKLFGIEKLNVVRSRIPSCTHVDYSARIQTVTEATNPMFYRVIKAFEARTGVPVIVNTSFNVRGEPIVCTPDDALNCFLGTQMDALVLENCLIHKRDIPEAMHLDYKHRFHPD